jgi:Leucine-rich repeat (LRR) protein
VKLTSNSVLNVQEIELINYDDEKTTRLETSVPLSGLKKLTARTWANEDLPFHHKTNLEYVSVETSDLSIISSGQLKCLTKLRTIEVKSTKRKSSKFFFNLTKNSNKICTTRYCNDQMCFFINKGTKNATFKLSSELLSGLPSSLAHLTIAGINSLTAVDPYTFHHLPGLDKLSLKGNAIEQIEPAAFNYPNNIAQLQLKILDLSGNQLNSIPKRSVTNFPMSLVNLDLSYNKIVDIETGAFEDLVNLRSLSLAENNFKILDLRNILNSNSLNLLFLDIRGKANMQILWHEFPKQEDAVNTKIKWQLIKEAPKLALKRNRVVVCVCIYSSYKACFETLSKLADEGIIRISNNYENSFII